MFEFSHEANAALHVIHSSLKVLVDTSIHTTAAKVAFEGDPDAFLHKIGKAALDCTRAVELLVAAVSESARQTGVFPTVIPRRPQPINGSGTAVPIDGGRSSPAGAGTSGGGGGGGLMGAVNALRRTRSVVGQGALGASSALTQSQGAHTARLGQSASLAAAAASAGASTSPTAPGASTSRSTGPQGQSQSGLPRTSSTVSTRTEQGRTTPPAGQSKRLSVAPPPSNPNMSTRARPDQLAAAHHSERVVVKHASNTDTKEAIVATTAYMLLELLVRETLAREAVWYSYQDGADEAKAIAIYSPKPRANAAARQQLRTGIVGAVLRSGMAVNVSPEQPTETNPIALCFPVFPSTSRTHPIGAVTLLHKATCEPFSKTDEAVTAHWTMLAARLFLDYGVDLTIHSFDPFRTLMQHTSPHQRYQEMGLGTKPYGNLEQARHAGVTAEARMLAELMDDASRLLELQANDAEKTAEKEALERKRKEARKKARIAAATSQSSPSGAAHATATEEDEGLGLSLVPKAQHLRSRAAGLQAYSSRLASAVAEHPPPFLVFRTVHNNHFTTVRGARLTGSGVTLQTQNMMDVAEYVQSLEECWRRTAEDLQGIEQEHVAQMDDFRARKRKLKAAQTRATELEQQRAAVESRYQSLKVELATICGRPVDDGAFATSGSAGDVGLGTGTGDRPGASTLPNVKGAKR